MLDRDYFDSISSLGPFEIKDELIKLARTGAEKSANNEIVTHEYLMWSMCIGHRPDLRFDLYPVEGGTAAMCCIFKALENQRLLNAGDTIALGTPIFTPYLEMPELEDSGLHAIRVSAGQEDKFQFTDENFDALAGPQVKALFLVRLAGDHGIVLLDGSGFAAPNWSARVSFADLNDEAYAEIGRAVRSMARGYVQAFQASKGERITA